MENKKLVKKSVILYHASCMDGLASASIMYENLIAVGEDCIDCFPMQYESKKTDDEIIERLDNLIELDKNTKIFVVDFSFSKKVTEWLLENCYHFVLLDHHKTAAQNLKGIKIRENSFFNIDLSETKSGAMLCYDFCKKNMTKNSEILEKYEELITRISDRDLWHFKYDDTKLIYEFLNFKVAKNSVSSFIDCIDTYSLDEMIEGGKILLQFKDKNVTQVAKAFKKHPNNIMLPIVIKDDLSYIEFNILNSTNNISEIGNEVTLVNNKPTIIYFVKNDSNVILSLRSTDEVNEKIGITMDAVAKSYNGGGHACAAGFELSFFEFSKLCY